MKSFTEEERDALRTENEALRAEIEAYKVKLQSLRTALDWIAAEPEDPVRVQLWARAALGKR